MAPDASYARTVSGWAAHLRAGGATPWAAWLESGHDGAPEVEILVPLPDAVHLELLRRINLAAGAGERPLPGLADRVLTTASPGRGLVDVPLPWPAEGRRFGTPPIDPAQLPVEELLRLASGVLAHLLSEVAPPSPREARARRPLPWRRRFHLHGAPGTTAAIREGLLEQGFVESDRRTTHVVIALPVDVMVAEHWASTVRAGGILKWRTLWRRAQKATRLPAAVDAPTIAGHLHGRPRDRVHVVVAQDAERAAELVARVLGGRPAVRTSGMDLAAYDLVRRVNRLTAMTHGTEHVREHARALLDTLEQVAGAQAAPAVGPPVPTPLAPRFALPWARTVAATTAQELRAAGYPVHGDPAALAPTDHRLPGTVDRGRTLELAVAACARLWDLTHPRLGGGRHKEGGGQP
jgi:hypothetical protein